MLPKSSRSKGLLVIRVGIGLMFVTHGYPKLIGGTKAWRELGQAMELFGIHVIPEFFGFMAAVSELVGGILLTIGLFTRIAASFMLITMIVATLTHVFGDGDYFPALTNAVIFLGLAIAGSGRHSLDSLLFRKR